MFLVNISMSSSAHNTAFPFAHLTVYESMSYSTFTDLNVRLVQWANLIHNIKLIHHFRNPVDLVSVFF